MKSMHIRDFLRGGYKDIKEPTQITKHGRAVATWMPYGQEWTVTAQVKNLGRQPARLPIDENL